MNCPFCLQPMNEVYEKPVNALHKIIDVYSCLDCQQPHYETYYKAVLNSENKIVDSDQFVIDKFHVYRSHDVVKARTAVYKNIAGILRTGSDPSAITLYPPACIIPGVVSFNFSNIIELKNRLNMLVTFS